MAIPTITSITPNNGRVFGGNLVKVVGTNFNLHTIPPMSGAPSVVPPPPMKVLFDGVEAKEVSVFTSTYLTCKPAYHVEGAVDVVIKNCDSNGAPIVGELDLLVDGYNYRRSAFGGKDNEGSLLVVIRELIQQLKKQVFDNVVNTTSTDFDINTMTPFIELPAIPALILQGPDLNENRFYSINTKTHDTDLWRTLSVPKTVDLVFTIIGSSDNRMQLISMAEALIMFFYRNKHISIDKDSSNPAFGKINYYLDMPFDGQPKFSRNPNKNNIHSFSSICEIRGFDIVSLPGYIEDSSERLLIDPGSGLDLVVESEQIG